MDGTSVRRSLREDRHAPAVRRLQEIHDFYEFLEGEIGVVLDRWERHRAEREPA